MTEKIRAGRRTADQRLSVEYAHDLEAARRAAGGTVESWIVEGAGHVEAMNLHPEEYEAGWSSSSPGHCAPDGGHVAYRSTRPSEREPWSDASDSCCWRPASAQS